MREGALVLGQLFNGLSVGSILLLASLGLALTFGLMRVINMAHGELLMVGGYLAYLAHLWVPGSLSFLVALPLGFFGAALLGVVLEWTVIRHLYGRPLETLLATWGISLGLQQAARNLFGPTGVEVTAPAWLQGALTVEHGVLRGMSLPHVRFFVLALSVVVLWGLWQMLHRTRLGLYVRAVNQNREVCSAIGVPTPMVDRTVFALGAGLAGLAGAALALIAPVTPTVGQSYIVDAFLVVIVGGVGSLTGTALASALVGTISSALQVFTSVSFAKVLLLLAVVAFLQLRPRGLVSARSRSLEEAVYG
ncbi:MAG: urea ABC transporter permease subunit UrtB [Armatimonadetes bacterium]|nr:urea ABC transporter permease subunit UrtB [Armatimonadota bacterium]MDW8153306.1 urea ABC transporter permease subunit UrtB [Armatimonadota bacterium]